MTIWDYDSIKPLIGKIVTFSLFGQDGEPIRKHWEAKLVSADKENATFDQDGKIEVIPLRRICGIWFD